MIKTAIILAGGFGTRLQSVVTEVPKPMAPVAGHPFLEYLLAFAYRQGVEKTVLSVGYKKEVIKAHFGAEWSGMKVEYAVEDEPLGTGGAIWNALKHCEDETVVVLNGDSLFEVDIQALYQQKKRKEADMVLSLKPMKNFDRYGVVEIDANGRILEFKEKTFRDKGLINGGVYCFDAGWAHGLGLSGRFSFEKEVLEHYIKTKAFYGYISEAYFIDIGMPEDYKRAQNTFKEKLNWLH
jgi:D-glycero-alpha-D-manno-heptose 1-phosphate guanylyltransferase